MLSRGVSLGKGAGTRTITIFARLQQNDRVPKANIILGIGGSIAAAKTPRLVRLLRKEGAVVQPVLTRSGKEFVTATTLSALSGRPVRDELWDMEAEHAMNHIELARWADLLVVAPASANVLGSLANGLANDLLSCIYLATAAPVLVAPAMNQGMWNHPATQRNVATLRADGVQVVGPATGEQACGDFGPGRMLEPEDLAEAALQFMADNRRRLDGLRILVTAGPTREALDPVRYISNASSGRQGFAVAQAACEAGAHVTLVSGPVELETPSGVERVDVVSASDMSSVVMERVAECDMVFAVAAVADHRPERRFESKIKRQRSSIQRVQLVENEDIIGNVGSLRPRPFLVGFAAETEDILANAREKRLRKNLDAIVVNDVSDQGLGFDSAENEVTLIHSDGEELFERASKLEIARKIVNRVSDIYHSAAASRLESLVS